MKLYPYHHFRWGFLLTFLKKKKVFDLVSRKDIPTEFSSLIFKTKAVQINYLHVFHVGWGSKCFLSTQKAFRKMTIILCESSILFKIRMFY